MMFTFETPSGWLSWSDGTPPKVLLAESEFAAVAAGAESGEGSRFDQANVTPVLLPIQLHINKRVEGRSSISAMLKWITSNAGRYGGLSCTLSSSLSDDELHAALGCVREIVKAANESGPSFGLSLTIQTTATAIQESVIEYLESRVAYARLCMRDVGGDEASSKQRETAASLIADRGITVSAELVLKNGDSVEEWLARLNNWRTITRNGDVHVLFDWEGAPSPISSGDAHFIECISAFCEAVYGDLRFDLWRIAPFSTLLRTVTMGSGAVRTCGSDLVACLSDDDFVVGCLDGNRRCASSGEFMCDCRWGIFCDIVGGMSLRRMRIDVPKANEGHAACAVAARIVPMIFADIARVIRGQSSVSSQQSQDRYRIAARDGKPVIWKDSVITDHRPRRGENADGTRKHLDIAQLGTDGSSTNSAATAS